MNTEDFKLMFDRFKKSKSYMDRLEQSKFIDIARNIIIESLKLDNFTNETLTSFIQMFKANAAIDNFEKYLKIVVLDENARTKILNDFKTLNQKGFTSAGKFKIRTLNSEQLSQFKSFLELSFNAKTLEDAIKLVKDFENLNIPEVRSGIYSPWLHYINPVLFPIINTPTKKLTKYLKINTNKYSNAIIEFHKLKDSVKEDNFSEIDYFCWIFDNSFTDKDIIYAKIYALKLNDDSLKAIYDKIVNKNLKFSSILRNEFNVRNGSESEIYFV